MSDERHVIVGGGLAGAKAAEALRAEGHDGEIVLIGAEDELPYERPPLSKDYLRGESSREDARVHAERFYAEQSIELRTGANVAAIDPAAREVELEGGERLGWDKLLLATGSEPRRLDVPGAGLDGVLYLRDLDDSDAIAARLEDGLRLAVVGAGWIGSEVAASAREKGADVEIVERAARPLEHVLGAEASDFYARVHRDHGVTLRAGAELERFEGSEQVTGVRLGDGEVIDCDLVVVGIGIVPRTGLAEAAGLEVDDGIVTDERLETSAPGIFACGDVASAHHPFYGRRLRVEHWANALHQPETAARAMLGKDASYDRIPYFFSDQYDVGMEYSGYATEWERIAFRGDPGDGEFIAFWLQEGRVIAGMNVNVWDVTDPIQALIRSRREVDSARLEDPDVPLDRILGDPGE
jgi:3-phenylpropionate/trans-cinnamate dioxygenase ferredoxin reductase subunit